MWIQLRHLPTIQNHPAPPSTSWSLQYVNHAESLAQTWLWGSMHAEVTPPGTYVQGVHGHGCTSFAHKRIEVSALPDFFVLKITLSKSDAFHYSRKSHYDTKYYKYYGSCRSSLSRTQYAPVVLPNSGARKSSRPPEACHDSRALSFESGTKGFTRRDTNRCMIGTSFHDWLPAE